MTNQPHIAPLAADEVYLDHAATTPTRPAVIEAVADAMRVVGNASSLHGLGRAARRRVEESRETIAATLRAKPSEVLFTSGGTEADNIAVAGIVAARQQADPTRRRLLLPAIEHHAVLDCAEALHTAGRVEITWLEVDDFGRVHADTLAAAIAEDPDSVALVSVMWANNEVGTVNPIRELADVAHAHGIPLHTDAVQAFGALPIDFAASGADAMTVTAHKIGGPIGVGALVLKRDVAVIPIGHGGGQERGIRSGTLDMPALAGFAVAAHHAAAEQAGEAARLAALRDRLVAEVRGVVPDALLSGDPGTCVMDGGPSRLPGNAHVQFPGCQGDVLLMLLDAAGIACSVGSACTAGVARPSHVLIAMGLTEREAGSALRFTLGHTSTDADVDALVAAIGPAVERARAAAMAGSRR